MQELDLLSHILNPAGWERNREPVSQRHPHMPSKLALGLMPSMEKARKSPLSPLP